MRYYRAAQCILVAAWFSLSLVGSVQAQAAAVCKCENFFAPPDSPSLKYACYDAATEAECKTHERIEKSIGVKTVGCIYQIDNSCVAQAINTVACGGTVCAKSAKTCATDRDCEQPAGNFICYKNKCFFDETAKQLYEGGDAGMLGIKANLEFHKPLLEFRIPGLSFTDVKNTLDSEGYIHLPYIGELIATIYKFGMVVGSIIAAVIVVMSGAKIIVSAGGEGKMEGYKRIGEVVIGLVIMWGSYALLFAINPDLVNFKMLKVKFIEPVPLPQENDSIPPGEYPKSVTQPDWTAENFNCSETNAPAGVVPPTELVTYNCDGINGSITTIKEMRDPLCKVAALAKQNGYTFNIIPGGSFRSFEDQVKGWCQKDSNLPPKERQKYRAVPGFSNHGHGRAVDLFPVKDGKQLYSATPRTAQCQADPKVIETVDNFFYTTDPKFNRLETEIWHFEYGTNGTSRSHYTAKPVACNG
ncbi:MAG: D-alanyl-D-alanine carboxypeptidase family protein [Candidatus Magasanikbacteria bacterium]|nr:D-alanyl-D-alanine carboxypeptidase family protein [Candidatus Magasanikbacteria bacterium]